MFNAKKNNWQRSVSVRDKDPIESFKEIFGSEE